MKAVYHMMKATPHERFRCTCKLLWLLSIACLMIVSCSTTPSPPTPPQTLQCGTINPATEGTASAENAGSCFWQAFQRCKPASLTYTDGKSNSYVFTVTSSASHCQVREKITSTTGTTTASTCSHLQAFRSGFGALILSGCSDNGNISVPVNPTIQ